ncbi:MAG: hypothetical protein D6724_04415 [Armatimonadetes bacterium]|nr:MAG: hypothetical protein D6724_04415 [Armatimonadota bacterium]
MVATAFMAVAVTALVDTIWTIHVNQSVARERAVALALAEDMIAEVRRGIPNNVLNLGTQSTTVSVEGIQGNVTKETSVSAVTGFSDLYRVVVKVAWATDSVRLETYVRYPDG